MSDCPKCGQPARHVFLKVPWDGSAPSVVHVCENAACPINDFSERAERPVEEIVAHVATKRDAGKVPDEMTVDGRGEKARGSVVDSSGSEGSP